MTSMGARRVLLIGKPGAGACPVRGHSNVQGDRTVGIVERPGEEFLRRLGEAFDFDPPREHGHAAVHAIEKKSVFSSPSRPTTTRTSTPWTTIPPMPMHERR